MGIENWREPSRKMPRPPLTDEARDKSDSLTDDEAVHGDAAARLENVEKHAQARHDGERLPSETPKNE